MTQPADALTAFEQRRLETIQRNNDIMRGMGIPALVPQELRAAPRQAAAAKPRRKRPAASPAEADTRDRRRSSRLANAPAPVFTTFDEDEDLGDERVRRGSHAAATTRQPRDDGEV